MVERSLAFAATPTFLLFAIASVLRGADPLASLCSAAGHGSVLTGMTAMYLLMAAFHGAPWLRTLGRRDERHRRERSSEEDCFCDMLKPAGTNGTGPSPAKPLQACWRSADTSALSSIPCQMRLRP